MRVKSKLSKFISKFILGLSLVTSTFSIAFTEAVSASLLPEIQDVPIQNPFRSKPSFKLGALPAEQTPVTPRLVKQWGNQLAFFSEGLSLYPNILPAVDNNTVYQANHKGQLVFLDRKTGKKRVKANQYLIASGPTLAGETLFITTQDAKIIALSKKTGALQWSKDLSTQALAAPTADEKSVIVYTIDGKVNAFNTTDGSLLWAYEAIMPNLILRGASSPVIRDNLVLLGLANGKVVALNKESGMLVWEYTVSLPKGRSDFNRMVDIKADLIVDQEALFVSSFQGHLTKIELMSGEVRWKKELSNYHTLAVDEEALYLTDAHHHIWAIDKQTGNTIWEQDKLANRYVAAPVCIGNFLAVGDKGGCLHWLDKRTGQLQGYYFVGNKIVSDLIVKDDQLLVTNQNGRMSVFKVISKTTS